MLNKTTDSESYHTILTAAHAYTERGWVVHQLSSPNSPGKSPGKRPLDTGWQRATEPPTEDKLNQWFGRGNPKEHNIGLVCGEASGVTVIDLDRKIYAGMFDGVTTLRSSRTPGRSHVYFQYNPRLAASKHHNLGIEVLSNGNNAVMPPSIHESGGVYKWNDVTAPIAEMPKELETQLLNLFMREGELNVLVRKCRPCFSRLFKKEVREVTDFHGAGGRELMVAWGAELKAAGATLADGEMWAKIIYGDKFDRGQTLTEWRNIDKKKTWRCETIAGKLSSIIECDCSRCKWRNTPPTTPAPAPTTPATPAAASGKSGKYEVLNYKTFRKLMTRHPETASRAIDMPGDGVVYELSGAAFIGDALELDVIIPYRGDDMLPRRVISPELLLGYIEKVETHEAGDDTTYSLYIRRKVLRFSISEISDLAAWRKKLVQCGLIVGFTTRSNEMRERWEEALVRVVKQSEIVWEAHLSEDDMAADLIMDRLMHLPVVLANADFVDDRAVLDRDDMYWISTTTVDDIVGQMNDRRRLSEVQRLLSKYLVKSSSQRTFDGRRFSIWFFKRWAE